MITRLSDLPITPWHTAPIRFCFVGNLRSVKWNSDYLMVLVRDSKGDLAWVTVKPSRKRIKETLILESDIAVLGQAIDVNGFLELVADDYLLNPTPRTLKRFSSENKYLGETK